MDKIKSGEQKDRQVNKRRGYSHGDEIWVLLAKRTTDVAIIVYKYKKDIK